MEERAGVRQHADRHARFHARREALGHSLILVVRAGAAAMRGSDPAGYESAPPRVSSRGARTHYDEICSSTLEWSQEQNANLRCIFGGIPAFGRGADISATARKNLNWRPGALFGHSAAPLAANFSEAKCQTVVIARPAP